MAAVWASLSSSYMKRTASVRTYGSAHTLVCEARKGLTSPNSLCPHEEVCPNPHVGLRHARRFAAHLASNKNSRPRVCLRHVPIRHSTPLEPRRFSAPVATCEGSRQTLVTELQEGWVTMSLIPPNLTAQNHTIQRAVQATTAVL
jgi:hypothetical protein